MWSHKKYIFLKRPLHRNKHVIDRSTESYLSIFIIMTQILDVD